MCLNIYMTIFIVSVDMKTEKKYVLSTDPDNIKPIVIQLDNTNKLRIKAYLANYIRSIIPMNIMGIIPQIINLHSDILTNSHKKNGIDVDENGVYPVYGCLVDHINPIIQDYHWIEFAFEIPNDYSSNIFEVCQYLK